MRNNRKQRIGTLTVGVVLALALGTGPGLAFEPPGDEPADLFSCNPSAVSGHPGGDGLEVAMAAAGNRTAWSAHDNGAVGNC